MAGSRVDGVHHGVTRSALDAVRRWAESEAEGRRREGDLVPLRVRSVQVGSGQQVARGQVDVGQRVAGIGAAVNRADDGLDRRAIHPQLVADPRGETGALERREPWGVWGGELFDAGRVIPRKRPRGRPRKHPIPA